MPQRSSTVRAALNRLIVVCRDEVMALEAAALTVGGERKRRLEQQASRRVIFQRDLARAVATLGGVPAKGGSPRHRLARALAIARSFFVRSRRVEIYDACARATDKSARVYAAVLKSDGLPGDVLFGLEGQYREIESDRNELCWLRFGSSLTQSSSVPSAPVPAAVATT